MTKTIKCPDCEEAVIIPDDFQVGKIIECQNCAAELEIISTGTTTTPPQVNLIIEEK